MANGTYRFPAIQFDVAVGVTNTTPMGAYRGAGRPEATALLERLVDHAALELGIDPIELRRRNFLGRRRVPVPHADRRHLRHRPLRDAARRRRRRRSATTSCAPSRRSAVERGDRVALGIGVSAYVEITAGGGASEFGAVEVHDDGSATVRAGHVLPRPGPPDGVRHARPRPDRHPGRADPARRRRHRPRPDRRRHGRFAVAAARRVGGAPGDGGAGRQGQASSPPTCSRPTSPTSSSTSTPARSAWPACRPARRWATRARAAPGGPAGDDGAAARPPTPTFDQGDATFPFGAHIAVVEVDLDTGQVRLRAPRRRRRLRHRDQPAARRGPAARRRRRRHRPGAVRGGPLRRRRQPADRQPRRLRRWRRPPSCRASRCTPRRRRRRSTRSAPRASARRPRSAPRRPCRTP